MESCRNQKRVNKIKIYFRYSKVATLCLDDSFAHSWHSLNQLHLECFSNSLEVVPTYVEHFSFTRWDGVSLQNAVVAMLVKCALNSK